MRLLLLCNWCLGISRNPRVWHWFLTDCQDYFFWKIVRKKNTICACLFKKKGFKWDPFSFWDVCKAITRDPFGTLLVDLMISLASIPFCEMQPSKVSAYSGKILFHNFPLYWQDALLHTHLSQFIALLPGITSNFHNIFTIQQTTRSYLHTIT
jgi:hypothetical protein